jgi:hypothetical protein
MAAYDGWYIAMFAGVGEGSAKCNCANEAPVSGKDTFVPLDSILFSLSTLVIEHLLRSVIGLISGFPSEPCPSLP